MFLSFFEWLGGPAVIAQLRIQLAELQAQRAVDQNRYGEMIADLKREKAEMVAFEMVEQLRSENTFLREQLVVVEEERKKLQDSALEKAGARVLNPEPMGESFAQPEHVFEDRIKADIQSEVAQLERLSEQDPETYTPLLQEAVLRYHTYLQ